MERMNVSSEDVPIIDMTPWCSTESSCNDESGAKDRVAKEIYDAFTTIGFVTLVNHGVDDDRNDDDETKEETCTGVTRRAFEASKKFFRLPRATKLKYQYQSNESNRGYIATGQERFDGVQPDWKETFDIGFEGETAYSNRWPTEELGEPYRDTMLAYFEAYDHLHLTILRALARGMGLQDDYFIPLCNANHQNLRLLHYPECDRTLIEVHGQKRGGIHTDYGTITLLSQEHISGLVAQRLDGTWVSVPPTPGGIVVNVGEMLQRWSNNVLRATPHQVLDDDPTMMDPDKKSPTVPERYSIAFFCNANKDTTLSCLPNCHGPDQPPKYEPINAFDYLTMRLSSTIAIPN